MIGTGLNYDLHGADLRLSTHRIVCRLHHVVLKVNHFYKFLDIYQNKTKKFVRYADSFICSEGELS